ncbi:MAG: carbohydrate-binding domain-containing protein, partial [Ruminococcaceae bacterium]|nr:carbohydrate-binding domain-containing protein [Oscillospiraceae bacterium]
MKRTRILALLLTLCMLLSFVYIPSSADEAAAIVCRLTGNTGAKIYAPSGATATTESDLVTLSQSGNIITVTAVEGAEGIAEVDVSYGGSVKSFEIPVGYTTFVFDGDKLTVIEGADTKYEIAGINAANEEYLEGDATYPLPVSYDSDGNAVYENTDAYSINVAIKKKGGNYVFYGQSDDMSICVKKEATAAAYLHLAGLDLTSSFTSPVTVKKNSTSQVFITALGGFYNTLSDSEFNNADIYGDTADGGDGSNAEYAESSVIKGKDYANITINGEGTIDLNCATKNAIKVNDYGALTIEDVTLNVNSVKHGISSDNTLTVNSGNISVSAAEDGIRCDPDSVDSTLGLASVMTVNGGYISIKAGNDGMQSAQDIVITGGVFNITAGEGYNDPSFNKDTMSCKGIKTSYNGDDTTVDTATLTMHLNISGGIFILNTADDALHSDAYITITGGYFDIWTSDDGIHSDTTLIMGTEGGSDDTLSVNINTCYEGIESGTIYFYSGTYNVEASNDGVNAAGGSDSSDDNGGFNPGGGKPGGNWGGSSGGTTTTTSDYNLYFYGGSYYINVTRGDGLDSNGGLYLYGGDIVVWGSPQGQDGEPFDCDGTFTVKGATVFGAGTSMMQHTPSNSQSYIKSTSSAASGKTINIKNGSTTVFNTKAIKNLNYVFYSSPTVTSSWTISFDTSALINTHTCSYTKLADIEASCGMKGSEFYCCSTCYDAYSTTEAALTHSMSSYISWNDGDCGTGATTHSYCTKGCDKTIFEIGEANGTHSYYVSSVIDPTCTEAGYTVYTCSACGDNYTANETAATGHTFGEWYTTLEPTAETVGEQRRDCINCDAYETNELPIVEETEPSVKPEISVDGYDVSVSCASDITYIRYAKGVYTTGSDIKNAPDCVTLGASKIASFTTDGVCTLTMADGGIYSVWVKTSEGKEYVYQADLSFMEQSVESYGVSITVNNLYGVKDYFICPGDYDSYSDIKANYLVLVTANKINGAHSYTYVVPNPGRYTIYIRYEDSARPATI